MTTSQIIITNENIGSFVEDYIRDKNSLPVYLRDIGAWDVSNVTDMEGLFQHITTFNEPLHRWNVSNVTTMGYMFHGATSFNQSIHEWDVSKVTNMEGMFIAATSFNQPLENWNVSNVENMNSMFSYATSFNQPLVQWNVSNVADMSILFSGATSFNQPLNGWDVSNVRDMHDMFSRAIAFNQPLNLWNVSNVTNMSNMFSRATTFNRPLEDWNVGNVENMNAMFLHATSFNQPLNRWNVANVRQMANMFMGATSFNQPLNEWDIRNVRIMHDMFSGAIAFRYPPPAPRVVAPEVAPQLVQGRAYEIHNAFHELDLNRFISILSTTTSHPHPTKPLFQPLIRYVQFSSQSLQKKQETIYNLIRIENAIVPTLESNPELLKQVFATIFYVSQQSPEFVDVYLNNFTFDCLNAYQRGQSSCVKGMIERVFLIIRDVVATFCVEEGNPLCKEEYRELLKTFYPEVDLNKLFQDWYAEYSENAEIVAMTAAQRMDHFKQYVREKLRNEEEYQRIAEKIEKYIHDNHEIFDRLTLGGGRRSIKRKVKTKRAKRKATNTNTKTKRTKRTNK